MSDENQNSAEGREGSEPLLCFYVAYQTKDGASWRIIKTPLDIDKASDLIRWIEEEGRKRGTDIVPIFWKRLDNQRDLIPQCCDECDHFSGDGMTYCCQHPQYIDDEFNMNTRPGRVRMQGCPLDA